MPKHLLPSKPLKPPSGYELMKDFLAKFKRKPRVLGDGNCLFRALSAQLTGTEENHIALRKIIVEFEAKNPSNFGKKVQAAKRDFTAHLESMQKIFVWGSDIEIEAAASLFQTEIYEATDCPVRWLKFSPISKSLLSSLACADSIKIRPKQGWVELLFTNNHFDSIQPESTTVKLTKPTLLETQATINTVHFDCEIQTADLAVAACRTDV